MPKKSGEPTLEFLLDDFFDEVERVLTEHGIPFEVVEATEGDSP